jgi:hypothetical protein
MKNTMTLKGKRIARIERIIKEAKGTIEFGKVGYWNNVPFVKLPNGDVFDLYVSGVENHSSYCNTVFFLKGKKMTEMLNDLRSFISEKEIVMRRAEGAEMDRQDQEYREGQEQKEIELFGTWEERDAYIHGKNCD